MVESGEDGDLRTELANNAREQQDAYNAMDRFDNRMRGVGDDSSSDEEDSGPRRPRNQLELEQQKNQILMDKLFRA